MATAGSFFRVKVGNGINLRDSWSPMRLYLYVIEIILFNKDFAKIT